jgi:hypothetical protein
MWTLGDKYNVLTPHRAALELLEKLAAYKPFIFKHSAARDSYYIHFKNLPNGLTHKLRVSNHDERDRYGYKWQLRLDGRDHIRNPKLFRYYFSDIDSLVKRFNYYYQRVESLNAELLAERPREWHEDYDNADAN